MSKKKITTVLAFDWGSQKIGAAVGQALTKTATPLPEMRAKDGIPNWDDISALVDEWQPDAFVVGLPLNMDDTENECTPRARKFGNRLNARYGLPWFPVDERLSSFDARKTLAANARETGIGPKKGRLMDSVAAALILETWFASHAQDER
ncbi:MAG: Holliday junction resolvase RuvX [Pseudomonadales bacterium]|nr:Holliday junction resolvase RuvX [Pseudomonadales bacterium]